VTLHYHGTPITPRSELLTLAGRSFCVSYAEPRDVEACHRIGQSVLLDNGAYTTWRQGRDYDPDGFCDWAEPWLDHPTTWAVIPDLIDGDEDANDRLLVRWFRRRLRGGAPVWHLHEPLERLRRLAHGYDRVCLGSSRAYAEIGTDHWHRRIGEAFNTLADERGRVPWVHMLRGMSLAGSEYPFASLDSTDVARNHNRAQNTALRLAERWDALQCPPRWQHIDQLDLLCDTASA
jgi:hypothetical protein